MTDTALPPVVDTAPWERELDALRVREKAATRELDAIAAQRRRMPAVSHIGLIDVLPYGRQEEWQDSPDGWPKSATYSGSQDIAAAYGPNSG